MGRAVRELCEVLSPGSCNSGVADDGLDAFSCGPTPCEESLIDVIYREKKKSLEMRNVGLVRLAREEAAVEETMMEMIMAGEWAALKPNSGESVGIGDHYVCVYCHQQASSYQTWEWNGFIILFDVDQGTTRNYIYGHYFEALDDDGCSENSKVGFGCYRAGS